MLELSVSNIVFTLINILILFAIFKKFLFGRVSHVLDERAQMVEKQKTELQQAADEVHAKEDACGRMIADNEAKGEKILSDAHDKATEEYNRIVNLAHSDSEKIIAQAQEKADSDIARKRREFTESMAQMVTGAVEKISGMESGPEQDKKLYDLFLKEAGEEHGQK